MALVFSLATVLTANQCGAFGDACDDYGTTSPTFFVMLALTILAIVAFIAGLVLLVRGFSRRRRVASGDAPGSSQSDRWDEAYHPGATSRRVGRHLTPRPGDEVTSDSSPTEPTPQIPDAPHGDGGKRKRPVVWMVLAGVAVAAAIGLGVWAVMLNDDLNDTESQLEAQTAAAELASAEAERRIADARASIDDSLSGVAGIVVVSDEDVAEAEQAVADAEQSVAEAQAAVDQAQSEVEQALAERDLARAEAEQARAEAAQAELCADASLAATQALAEEDDAAEAYEEAAARAETAASAC